MSDSPIPNRIASLRAAMRQHDVAACLVPSADPHLSEYLPPHWQARTWLSGFDGSAGSLVLTLEFAGLWTDSRYFEQAERQLEGSGIELMRLKVAPTPEYRDWLVANLGRDEVLAVAGDSVSLAERGRLAKALAAKGSGLRTDLDLVREIWPDRPALPAERVFPHPIQYAVVPRQDKLASVREQMASLGASHHLISSLDDIAWLTNLRGSDVAYNPVFLAHALVDAERCRLFTHAASFPAQLVEELAADGIVLADYASARDALRKLPADASLLLDPARVVADLGETIPHSVERIEHANPTTAAKAIKNAAQLACIREVMREDGVALVHAMHGIERDLAAGVTLTELDVDTRLREARASRDGFVGESFATIAGYRANGALPHYAATEERHAVLEADGLLLIDSGGQYLGGTTDITRMWAFGETSAEERHDVSLVLKGMISLSRARFPEGASGPQLDALARAPLWAVGCDFGHGTGHGVGQFLNVHEGPHGIRPPASGAALVALEPGMITSIEPGLYKPDRHGVRHENLAVVRIAENTEFGTFLAFETLTLCPIDTRALDLDLLDQTERDWLDAYHAEVFAQLAPAVEGDARDWLATRCKPIGTSEVSPQDQP